MISPLQSSNEPEVVAPSQSANPARRIIVSSSALGAATALERGLGFLANFTAARVGGAGLFGAYSLALTTANSIASYAGGGIGSTATRFSGEFSQDTRGYLTIVRALLWVSSVSALLAAVVLAAGAEPIARFLLRNTELTALLRWSALSAGAIILLECWRGFFIGQREYRSLLLLSAIAGMGWVLALPWATRQGPTAMVISHASVALVAVLATGFASWRSARRRTFPAEAGSTTSLAKRVWAFGLMQLAGIAGLNVAGLWVAAQVARADQSLVQMGLFAVANQLRNMAAIAPGLLTQSSYGMLAEVTAGSLSPHERVMTFCSLGAGILSVLISGITISLLPIALPALFGSSFQTGVLPTSLALATAIIHMVSSPAAARLTVVSLRSSGMINACWAAVVVVLATILVPAGGAISATSVYLSTHFISLVLVLLSLRSFERLPEGLVMLNLLTVASAASLVLLAILREQQPGSTVVYSAAAALITLLSVGLQLLLGRREGWIPNKLNLNMLRLLVPRSRKPEEVRTI